MKKAKIDKPFLILTCLLCFVGFLLFFSVSLGTLESTGTFLKTIVKQFIALSLGLGAMFGLAYYKKIDYKTLKYFSIWLFLGSIVFELLVFVPGLGLEINGARRWVDIGITTLQPSEFLKITTILFLSALAAEYGTKMKNFWSLVLVMSMTIGVVFLLLFATKDIGSFLVIALATLGVLYLSKAKNFHIFGLAGLGVSALLLLVFLFRRYAWDRLVSFSGVSGDALGNDFQINQSLYTIGSGEIFGRGFGQSLQKFAYLPEPLTDSIFAVTAEEWGFVGSIIVILLFLALVIRGINIAKRSRDLFGRYMVTGLILLIGIQSFINIAAMLKLFPLSGMPLHFISQGGSALLGTLIICGLILNVSRHAKKKV